jgi:hypothetical protein
MMRAFSFFHRRGFHVLGLLATLFLSACGSGGTGDGNTLASVAITDTSFQRPTGNFEAFQCFSGQLLLLGTFDDGSFDTTLTSRATWQSSNPAAVQVSNGDLTLTTGESLPSGALVPSSLPGAIGQTATITAQFVGLSASVDVIVRPGNIEVSPTRPAIAGGTLLEMFATAILGSSSIDTPGTNRAIGFNNGVVWESTNTAAATVDRATGVVTAVAPGQTTIRAIAGIACPTPLDAETVLTVNNETLQSISLQPATLPFALADIGRNTRAVLFLLGNYTNGFRQDLTRLATLVSDTPTTIAVFSNFLLQSQADSGTSVLTASFDPDGAGTLAAVTTPTNATINSNKRLAASGLVTPPTATLLAGTFADLDAIGSYVDQNGAAQGSQNLYRDVTWAMVPADTAVASVTGIGRVIASATTTGMADTTATRLDPILSPTTFTDTTAVRVEPFTAASVQSLAVTCPEPVPAGTAADCTATLTFSAAAGGGTQDVSLFVLWSSSAPAVADVSNVLNPLLNDLRKAEIGRTAALAGRVYGAGTGTTIITAALFDASGVLLASGTDSINNNLTPPPPDADGDGVTDAQDACPNTPMGTTVNNAGCPDADGDGVQDATDNCPNTANANQANNDADATGDVCDTDDDNDTVPDTGDQCPLVSRGTNPSNSRPGCPCNSPNPLPIGARCLE